MLLFPQKFFTMHLHWVLYFLFIVQSEALIVVGHKLRNAPINCRNPVVPQKFINVQQFEDTDILTMVLECKYCFDSPGNHYELYMDAKTCSFRANQCSVPQLRPYANLGSDPLKCYLNLLVSKEEIIDPAFLYYENNIKMWTNGTDTKFFDYTCDWMKEATFIDKIETLVKGLVTVDEKWDVSIPFLQQEPTGNRLQTVLIVVQVVFSILGIIVLVKVVAR